VKQLQEYFNLEFAKNAAENPFGSSSGLWKKPCNTLKTPVPTLRVNLTSKSRTLQCDLTFSSGLGVENTKLIHHLFDLQPEAFGLYHFVRIWIHIDEFSFKRYMVGLLVIFYLQSKNLLPSVVQLQEDVPEKFIDGEFL
jgi:DNA polymerase sigma